MHNFPVSCVRSAMPCLAVSLIHEHAALIVNVQAGIEDVPGPSDIVMFVLAVWNPHERYVEGTCPSLERFFPFLDWYTGVDERGMERSINHPDTGSLWGVGSAARAIYLSSEVVCASSDLAVKRWFETDGYRSVRAVRW